MRGFCPLASGSKGNSLFVGTENTRILIDAGIRTKPLFEKLALIGVNPDTIQAILVTHEHIDHIAGIAGIAEKLKIPVFANADTAKAIVETLGVRPRFKIFSTGDPFCFGDLEIHPFSIPHDTVDPVAFTICTSDLKMGFCTDLGAPTALIRKQLELCDYIVLEANHEPSMVHACARPQVYKTRVLGKQGHLSNSDCGKLLASVFHPKLQHVHLAHLSSECNTEEVALQVVRQELAGKEVPLSIAYQDKVSTPIHIFHKKME
jgi:phosphoribosyl 1,2-cyclic phosphodiesterase